MAAALADMASNEDLEAAVLRHCKIRLGASTVESRREWRRKLQVAFYNQQATRSNEQSPQAQRGRAATAPRDRKRAAPTSRTQPFQSTKADPNDSDDTVERKHLQRLVDRDRGPAANSRARLIHQEFDAYGGVLKYMVGEIAKTLPQPLVLARRRHRRFLPHAE